MRQSTTRLLATALLAGCLGPATAAASGPAVTLAPASPGVELALGPAPASDAILQVVVSDVRNPDRVPVSILVTLQDHEKRVAPVEVMRFALFPPDQPGRFTGRVDKALEQLSAHLGARPVRFVLTAQLDPAAGPGRATSVELQISAGWMAAPGTVR